MNNKLYGNLILKKIFKISKSIRFLSQKHMVLVKISLIKWLDCLSMQAKNLYVHKRIYMLHLKVRMKQTTLFLI